MRPEAPADPRAELSAMLRHWRCGTAMDSLLRHGNLTGHGVWVALLDTGIHRELLLDRAAERGQPPPDLQALQWTKGGPIELNERELPSSPHGSVVADILLTHAPAIKIVSVDIFGSRGLTDAETLAHALHWTVSQSGCRLANLSLGVAEADLVPLLRRMQLERAVQEAYLNGLCIIAAAHNDYPTTKSFPAHFSSGVLPLVQAPELRPQQLSYMAGQPIEFAACGLGSMGAYLEVKANSWAAPQVTAMGAKLIEVAPDLRPFELKTLLYWAARSAKPLKPLPPAA